MYIGERIGFYASKRNVSIRQLAAECDINYQTLYNFIKRDGQKMDKNRLEKIANALDVKLEDLLITSTNEQRLLTDAEFLLLSTVNSIVGTSTGDERENKLYLINSILETNSNLIISVFEQLSAKKEK